MSEGIIYLRLRIMLLVGMMSGADVLSAMLARGMMCDVRHPSQEEARAGRRIYPPLELSVTSWRAELGRGSDSVQTCL